MVSKEDFEKAMGIINEYQNQHTHQIRDNIKDDCPTKEFEGGIPSGQCETDGHYMCYMCKNCDPDFSPITESDRYQGFKFLNYDINEKTWNLTQIVTYSDGNIDIENIDEDSINFKNYYTIDINEFINVNNNKKIRWRD